MRLEQKSTRQAGFSLIELLTVVTIIVVLSAIAYPNIAEYVRHYRLRGGTAEVVADLQRARSAAVMKNVNYGVLFVVLNAKTFRFVIEDVQATGVDRSVRVTPSTSPLTLAQAGPAHELPQGIEFASAGCGLSGTGDMVRFDRLGMACRPSGTGPCPAVTTVGMKALDFANGSDVRLCLHDTVRKLSRLITLSHGGRVLSAPVAPGL